MADQAQLLPGTLDLLILKAVSLGPLHGYGVLLRIGQISEQALLIEQGALYPALVSSGAARTAESELGHVGEQSPRQVLRTHGGGAQASAGGNRGLEPPGHSHCVCPCRSTGGNMRSPGLLSFACQRSSFSALKLHDDMEEELRSHIAASRRRSGTLRPDSCGGRTPRAHRVRRP